MGSRRIKIPAFVGLSIFLSGCAGLNEVSVLGRPAGYWSNTAPIEAADAPEQAANESITVRRERAGVESVVQQPPTATQSAGAASEPVRDPLDAPPPPDLNTSSASSNTSELMLVPPPSGSSSPTAGPSQRVSLGDINDSNRQPATSPPLSITQMPSQTSESVGQDRQETQLAPTRSDSQVGSMGANRAAPASEAPSTQDATVETVVLDSTSVQQNSGAREFVPARVTASPRQPAPPAPGEIPLTAGDKNTVSRFEILKNVLDEGLMTPSEYNSRRDSNIGAFLIYTHEGPAVGLERPVPPRDAVLNRLRALRRSFEMGAISGRQHALERQMILDAILPAVPSVRKLQPRRPSDVIQLAASAGRLESLREDGLITDTEYQNEINSLRNVMINGRNSENAQVSVPEEPVTASQTQGPVSAPGLGIHLASYRSEAAANTGWEEVRRKYGAVLGDLRPIIRRVNLGTDRGIYYRLIAAPFSNNTEAQTACSSLKTQNQYCEPINLGASTS